MFDALIRRLSGTARDAGPLPHDEARLALGALMVRLARADGHYAAAETERIEAALAELHGLARSQAAGLRAAAEALEAEAPDTVRFTRALKEQVAHEDRAQLVEAMWSVVLADGRRDHHEDATMRLVAGLLGINDRDSGLARQRAAERHPPGPAA